MATTTKAREQKLTVDDICTDLGIERRTFYDWRQKNRAPYAFKIPNGELRIYLSEYERWLTDCEARSR